MLGEPERLPEMFPGAQPCSPVVIGSTPNIYGGNIDVSFVLSSKGTIVCNSSSSVLVLNRTSPSLLHTFVADTTQLSIAIQHTGNSFLHQHIPRKTPSGVFLLVKLSVLQSFSRS